MHATLSKKIIYTVLIAFLSISIVQASTLEIPNSQISIDLPDKWISFFDNGSLTLKSPDNKSVIMTFIVLKNNNVEQAVKDAEKAIIQSVGELDSSQEPTEGTINKLEYIEKNSTANEGKIAVSFALFKTPNKKVLMISSVGIQSKMSEFGDDLSKIVSSIKPISKQVATKNIIKPNSITLPFNTNKALELLFSTPNANSVSSWMPSPNTFSSIVPDLKQTIATTKAFGFQEYKYDETTKQIVFLYKTSFQKTGLGVSIIGAALFNCKEGNCESIWNNPALIAFGNYDDASPAKFALIGQNSYGAIIEAGDTHQGITSTNAILLAVYNNKVVIAAKDIPTYEDNSGTTDDPSKSYKFETKIEFIPGEHKRFYNMKVRFSGTTLEETELLGQIISRVIPAKFTNSYFWDDKGFYETEIECDGPVAANVSSNDSSVSSNIHSMLPVFDSVVRSIFNNDKSLNINNYSSKNKQLVWSILYHLAVNHGNLHSLIKVDKDTMHVPYKVMQEFATACFSDYDDLVSPPKSLEVVSYDKEWNRFNLQLSDSGPSFCRILEFKPLANNKYTVSVGYFDDEEEPLTATFDFVISPNTYAKMFSNSQFQYSVLSVKKVKY